MQEEAGSSLGRASTRVRFWRTLPSLPPSGTHLAAAWGLTACATTRTLRRAACRVTVNTALGRACARACILLGC